jgi:hypothetical protein
MRVVRSIAVIASVAALASCTAGGGTDPGSAAEVSPPPDTLFLGTDRGPVSVSLATGSVILDDPAAVPAPDGSRLYSGSVSGGATAISTHDAATGDEIASASIDGAWDVRLASASGELVALMDPLPAGVDAWTPIPRATTSIVVADPAGAIEPRTYELRGNFEPEAFSVDDARMFLIEYLPAEAPQAYRVRSLDLATGRVTSVAGRFKTPAQRMPGIRLRQVFAPEGAQLYTLYSSKTPAYAPAYGSSSGYGYGGGAAPADTWSEGDIVTFVHVLNLRNGWAYCVGMPKTFWDQPASAQAMATSPDGRFLFVVDAVHGVVAEMNTQTLEVVRTERVDLGDSAGVRTSAQVSADGSTLFVGTTGEDGAAVSAIDTLTLDVRDAWDMPGTVSGLGLSLDGGSLYVASGNRVLVIDPSNGTELTSVAFDGLGSILRIGTPGV